MRGASRASYAELRERLSAEARGVVTAEPAQQVGPDRRHQIIAVETATSLQRVDQIQRARRAVHHRHRGGMIEFDHRRRADP